MSNRCYSCDEVMDDTDISALKFRGDSLREQCRRCHREMVEFLRAYAIQDMEKANETTAE